MGGLETRACIANKIIPLHRRGSRGRADTVPEMLSLTEPGRSNPGERARQSLLLFWKHGTQVEQHASVFDPGNDRSRSRAQLGRKFIHAEGSAGEPKKVRRQK